MNSFNQMLSMDHLVPCNWRGVKAKFGPALYEIQRHAERALTQFEVLLLIDPRADLSELRDWLESNARRQFTMFAAYHLTHTNYETRATYRGVVFSFDSIAAAIYFKMRWFDNEPSVE